MEVFYIQLIKIDHDNNRILVESIDEQENIRQYVMDMLVTISENIGKREFKFKNGEETMKTYLSSFIQEGYIYDYKENRQPNKKQVGVVYS